jgi:hypothetical protein
MAKSADLPVDVIPIAPGYVEKSDDDAPRPVVAVGRNSYREYQACVLDDKGRLVFIDRVQPEDAVDMF